MKRPDLHDEFLRALQSSTADRPGLTNKVADILRIEREAAYRRLSGRVQFTATEIGVLAGEMGISLDNIIQKHTPYSSIPILMEQPLKVESMDVLAGQLKDNLDMMNLLLEDESELLSLFDSLPLEFCLPYPHLFKFMIFKWGYHYVGSEEFDDYSSWRIPENIERYSRDLVETAKGYIKVLYIWDYPAIWHLVCEISYFHDIHLISTEELSLIKQDIHQLLTNFEKILRGVYRSKVLSNEVDAYVSTVGIGLSCLIHTSKANSFCLLKNYFIQTQILNDAERIEKIRNWIQAGKMLSLRISEGNERERRLFFERQHRLVDNSP